MLVQILFESTAFEGLRDITTFFTFLTDVLYSQAENLTSKRFTWHATYLM